MKYAIQKIRENWMNMVNTNYNSTKEMINKLQELKGKTKLEFYKIVSDYYHNLNIRFDEDPFAKNAQGISTFYHEVFLLTKFQQTKPQVKDMKINYYDFYYTVIKNRDEKQNVIDQDDENDYINFIDIIPNLYVGIKPRETILR